MFSLLHKRQDGPVYLAKATSSYSIRQRVAYEIKLFCAWGDGSRYGESA